jgi:2'-5' RNA ligase
VRLFVAVNLPDDVRAAVWEAAAPLRALPAPIRWVAPDILHLTLKFLGDVATDRETAVVEGLEAAVQGAKPFAMEIGGFGAFPRPNRPRVVWVGCEATPPLELLQHRVEREMLALGFPLEGRPFHPHVTLGRVRKDARSPDLAALEPTMQDLALHDVVTVRSIDLMQSTLRPDGATYSVRHAAALSG